MTKAITYTVSPYVYSNEHQRWCGSDSADNQ